MQRKPIILILTARDEEKGASENLACAIKAVGTHNVVVLDDFAYDKSAKKTVGKIISFKTYRRIVESSALNRIKEINYRNIKKGRAFRIANAVKRYNPEMMICMSPYSHHCAVDSKRKTGFKCRILYLVPFFSIDRQIYDDVTDVFIVENSDTKSELVNQGIASKRVMAMGLPFDIAKKTPIEISASKQELGLPRATTVFLNAERSDNVKELFSLLLDQGNIINTVVYCEDAKSQAELRALADAAESKNNIVLLQKQEQFDEYLSASDAVITRYESSTLYKCFKLEKPVIIFGKGETVERQIEFLVEKGLVMRARENLEIVALLYKLLQTDVAASFVAASSKWVEMASVGNIANYLVSYIGV